MHFNRKSVQRVKPAKGLLFSAARRIVWRFSRGASGEIVESFREDLQGLWQKIRNAQAVQKLVLVINQTSSAAITDNPGESEADSTVQIQKSTVHNGEFPRWQPSEKLPIHIQCRASAKRL